MKLPVEVESEKEITYEASVPCRNKNKVKESDHEVDAPYIHRPKRTAPGLSEPRWRRIKVRSAP